MTTTRALSSLLIVAACTSSPAPEHVDAKAKTDAESSLKFDEPAKELDPNPPDAKADDAEADETPNVPKEEVAPVAQEITERVVAGLNTFTADIYGKSAGKDGNVVLSPASIAMALGMVHAGAKGDTAKEIADALHLSQTPEQIDGAFAALVKDFNAPPEGIELAVVDRLFGDAKVPFEKDYLARLDAVFGAPLETVDFVGNAEGARTRINTWVAEQTRDRIEDLMPEGSVASATKLVLVNAIYFKAQWTEPFPEYGTQEEDFFAASGKKRVKTMARTDHFAYAAHPADDLTALALPYAEGGGAKMVILLPDDKKGLPALEKKLTGEKLATWTSLSTHERVEVKLPRFEIEMPEPLKLKAILGELGITRAFDYTRADFTPIAPASEQLEISEGFHKAFIAVDEKGTEAAAATALGMRAGAAAPTEPPKQFHADHPFLFVITDDSTGAILFIGRVSDPSA